MNLQFVDTLDILALKNCTFIVEQQAKVNVSDNNRQGIIIDVFSDSILEVYDIIIIMLKIH